MQDNPADVAEGREVGRGGGEALREQDGDDGQVRAHQLPLRRRRRRQGVHEHQQARQRKRANISVLWNYPIYHLKSLPFPVGSNPFGPFSQKSL